MIKKLNFMRSLLSDTLLQQQIIEDTEYLNLLTEDRGILGNAIKKTTDNILSSIGAWITNGVITICNYAGGVCLIVGSIAILGMMADIDGKIGCKKYVIGSILVYIGIKCIIMMIV